MFNYALGAHVASAIWPHICLFTLSCCLVIDIVYNTFCYDWHAKFYFFL